MSDCIFCDIIAGKATASMVYRDNVCSAFLDTQPINAGHILVVPNDHAASLADLIPITGGHMFQVAQRLVRALRCSTLQCEGVNLFLADGEAANQEVFHVHLHIIPRCDGDGFGFTFGPEYHKLPERAKLDHAAQQIAQMLGEGSKIQLLA